MNSSATDSTRWAQVKDLFHRAVEQPAEDRSAFLAAECGHDSSLREEVERLLAAHDDAGAFIENAPFLAAEPGRHVSASTLTGRVIGRYEVGRLIGAGGMGEVYAGRDVELGREVALKIGSDGSLESHARVRREAQYASQLNHPHICTIYEVGVFDGQPFIVMELVEGEPLSNVIPRDGLDVDRTIRYGVQVSDALSYAHRHGVCHRDLKSDNVVITPDGRAKVLDFGLAQRLEPQQLKELSESRAAFPDAAQIAGTLSSMAPEVLRGAKSDERSDIWALGVLLYEMAAGAKPFAGATGFELSAAILHEKPPLLPVGVPSALQAIIGRCLAKDPGERYPAAGEVRSALETLQSAARIALPSRTVSRWWRTTAAAGLVTAIVAGAAVLQLRQASEESVAVGPSGRPAIAVMQFENVTGAEDVVWMSRGVPNMLVTGLAQTRGLDIVSAQRLHEAIRQTGRDSLESLDRSLISNVARRAGAGAVVVGSIIKAGADVRIDAQLEDLTTGRVLAAESVRGTDLFALVDQLAEGIRIGIGLRDAGVLRHVADISTSSLEAYRFYTEGITAYSNTRADDARKLLERAVTIDPTFAQAYLHLSLVARHQRMTKDADVYEAKAVEYAARLDERQRLLLKAEVAFNAGKAEDAIQAVEEIIAKFPDTEEAYAIACRLYQPVVGLLQNRSKHLAVIEAGIAAVPSSTLLRNFYGYALLANGRYPEAVRVFESYAELAPREPNPYDSLGEAHILMGSPEKAIEYYTRALTVQPSFFPSHLGRDLALGMLGRYEEALSDGPSLRHVDGFMLSRLGRYREAERLIADDAREADSNKNIEERGMLHLLLAVLALERKLPGRVAEHVRRPEQLPALIPVENRRFYSVVAHTLLGLAAVQQKQFDAARSHLYDQGRIVKTGSAPEWWWHKLLEGEIALALDDYQKAASAFAAGEPRGKMWVHLHTFYLPLLANNLPFRDGAARAAKARGDLDAAITAYRRLLTVGVDQKWTAMYEPRYVLEIARLLERTGDTRAALNEYQRFLHFWKNADNDLAELAEARGALTRLRK